MHHAAAVRLAFRRNMFSAWCELLPLTPSGLLDAFLVEASYKHMNKYAEFLLKHYQNTLTTNCGILLAAWAACFANNGIVFYALCNTNRIPVTEMEHMQYTACGEGCMEIVQVSLLFLIRDPYALWAARQVHCQPIVDLLVSAGGFPDLDELPPINM